MKHATRHMALIPALLLAVSLGVGCDGAETTSSTTGTPAPTECGEPGQAGCEDAEAAELSPDQIVSQLGHEELIALCEISKAFTLTRHQLQTDGSIGCTGEGLRAQFSFGDNTETSICEQVRDDCLEALQAEIGDQPSGPKYVLSCEPADVSPFPMLGCDITVADYELCLDAILAPLVFDKETFICGMAREDAMTFTPPGPAELPPECDPVASLCPSLMAMTEG